MAHRLAPEAELDLDDIWYFIATTSSNLDTADRLVDSITDRFFLLARHPQLGRKRDDLRASLRSFAVNEYVIFYFLDGEDVLILHVVRGSRNMQSLLS